MSSYLSGFYFSASGTTRGGVRRPVYPEKVFFLLLLLLGQLVKEKEVICVKVSV